MIQRPGLLALLLLPGLAAPAASFDPASDVTVVWSQGEVLVSAPKGAHLKARFLTVALAGGAGSVSMGALPAPLERDEAGDPIYHGQVRIPVSGQGLAGNVELEVRYQPCTEGPMGVCFLPATRRLRVPAEEIPAGAGPAAAVAVPALGGGSFSMATLKGSVAVVDFWASWCGPCRKSFPAMDRLDRTYKAKGLKVVGISLDEDNEAMARFLDSVPVGFQIARDPAGQLARQYQVVAMPTTLILDRDGRVVARFEGGGRVAEEEAAVAALLEGRALPAGTGATLAAGLRATGGLKAWERGHLADPSMDLDGDRLSRALWEHIHSSKEAAAGDGGAAGGGCGCN